jgi:hypothetical protein
MTAPLIVGQNISRLTFQNACTESRKWFRGKVQLFRPLPSDETISETQRILRKKCIPVLWRKLLNIKVFFVSFD